MTEINSERLRYHADRLERLWGERGELSEAIRDTLADAKSEGFDAKALRQVVKERNAEPRQVKDQLSFEFVLDTYRRALDQPTRNEQELRRLAEKVAESGEVSIRRPDGTDEVVIPHRPKGRRSQEERAE